jgi:hypothetical protein
VTKKSEKLKYSPLLPITETDMGTIYTGFLRPLILGSALVACLSINVSAAKGAAKKKVIPVIVPVPKAEPVIPAATSDESGTAFQELNFNKTLIIEGKVEKPQVQFTLLKEQPPEKEIRFETSFLKNILKLDRENTFKVGATYGRE